ncbi:MAG: HAMP domain-containing histidine kinase [Thermoleophilia bacterium]|nr:HAMP domain-containing histidine kinase [Thermoleophilia bacterium]
MSSPRRPLFLGLLGSAGVVRGALEALGLSVLLTLYLVAFRGYFTASLLCAVPPLLGVTGALLFSVRVRISAKRGPTQLVDEGLLCLVLLGVQTVGVLLVAFILKTADRQLVFWLARSDVLPFYAGALIAFCVFRPGLRLVLRWESARRRRLAWSMSGVPIALILALVWLGVAAFLVWITVNEDGLSVTSLIDGSAGAEAYLVWIVPAVVIWAVVSATLALVFLPLSAGLSYLATLPVVRRIEELADATRAFRIGERRIAVEVVGEDEVAQLTTDFNAMADDLSQYLAQLESERDRASRLLDARRLLFAEVSHELRTPIAIVRGYLDSIGEHWDERPPDSLKTDLEVIHRETLRLQSLVDDLFTVARAGAGGLSLALQPVQPATVISAVLDSFAGPAWERERITLTSTTGEDGLPEINADPRRMEQILFNLVRNAVRHTPPGGLVSVGAFAEAGHVRFEVHDTGKGIPPEDSSRIWERFYQSDTQEQSGEGAGLGLFIVRELTEAMGGSVELRSVPDIGSCFMVRIPRA